MSRQIVATAAVIDEAGRVLIARRPSDVRYGGLWEFPGGKVESGETCDQAVIRELAEEVGLDISAECLAPLCFVSEASEKGEFLILLYVVRTWQGEARALCGAEIQWVAPMRLGGYTMPPANQHLVAILRDVL